MRNTKGNAGRKWMLGMVMIAGLLGAGAVSANAAQVRFQAGYGGGYAENYIPACPGDGYVWVAGYYDGGYWVPGAWVFRGRGWDRDRYRGFSYGREFHNEHEREFYGRHVDDRRFDRDRGGERRFDDHRGHEGGYRGRR